MGCKCKLKHVASPCKEINDGHPEKVTVHCILALNSQSFALYRLVLDLSCDSKGSLASARLRFRSRE